MAAVALDVEHASRSCSANSLLQMSGNGSLLKCHVGTISMPILAAALLEHSICRSDNVIELVTRTQVGTRLDRGRAACAAEAPAPGSGYARVKTAPYFPTATRSSKLRASAGLDSDAAGRHRATKCRSLIVDVQRDVALFLAAMASSTPRRTMSIASTIPVRAWHLRMCPDGPSSRRRSAHVKCCATSQDQLSRP